MRIFTKIIVILLLFLVLNEPQILAANNTKSVPALGSSQKAVEKSHGKPIKKTKDIYGSTWYHYHKNYDQFYMVAFQKGKVVAVFTNSPEIKIHKNLKIGMKESKADDIEEKIHSQMVVTDYSYNGKVYAFLARKNFYWNETKNPKVNNDLSEQLFDVTNALRVQAKLKPLKKHSTLTKVAAKEATILRKNDLKYLITPERYHLYTTLDKYKMPYSSASENMSYGFGMYFANGLVFDVVYEMLNYEFQREDIYNKSWDFLGTSALYYQNSGFQGYFVQCFVQK